MNIYRHVVGWLLGFYFVATSKSLSGWVVMGTFYCCPIWTPIHGQHNAISNIVIRSTIFGSNKYQFDKS